MLDTQPNPRIAILLAAAALAAVACTLRDDASVAQQWRGSFAGIAAKADEPAIGTDEAVEDSELTAKVREAILADPQLQSQHVDVKTEDAAVTLTGTVDSEPLRDRAVQLAGSVDGVVQVQDRLDVRS